MRKRSYTRAGDRGEQGYALLLVVFLTTILLIATIAAAPSVRTERKREKEEEMVWRGKQYVRAIKLYYRKNGRFPTSLDDLSKPKTGTLRYLRQEYKDPMNKEDGSWRLIYVGPAGQLIGSLKPQPTVQLQGGSGQPGTPAAALGSQGAAQSGNTSQSAFGTSQSAFGPQSGGTSSFGTSTAAAGTAQGAFGPGSSNSASSPSSFSSGDSSSIIGGNIIGVGSKIDRTSVLVYEKATNYHLFEFIWDPSKDLMGAGGAAGTQVGTPVPPGQGFGQGFGQPIQNPAGSQPANNPNNPNSPNNLNNPQQQLPPLSPNGPSPQ